MVRLLLTTRGEHRARAKGPRVHVAQDDSAIGELAAESSLVYLAPGDGRSSPFSCPADTSPSRRISRIGPGLVVSPDESRHGESRMHAGRELVGLALLVGISSTLLTSVSYCSERGTSVTLLGTWLAFQFIHDPFHSVFLSFSAPLHFTSLYISLLSVAQAVEPIPPRIYIITHVQTRHSSVRRRSLKRPGAVGCREQP